MSLRDDLLRQIRYEMSSDPVASEAMMSGKSTMTTDLASGYQALNAYCIALQNALFKLADEVEALRA